ncbi:hypothetical protein GCM10011316_11790 [Roseibium aquae]|uniref:Uncharacterized protein n=1 Tax=Roseibium aquae TaxID=1323746 RepID=A0A916WZ77_9HYPH|nr:glycosyltransferase family 4 protein [Roseibium aquae]GGB41485.1 hypothetical protein GCM10011316_11790 [Roseibium aquae]
MRVLWIVSSLSMKVASVRLRTLLPALSLAKAGHELLVCEGLPQDDQIARADIVVINKCFGDAYATFARTCAGRGIPVLYDLCDNVFAPDYGDGSGKAAQSVREILVHCTALITTGPLLADAIVRHTGFDGSVHCIPDSEEPRFAIDELLRAWEQGQGVLAEGRLTLRPAQPFEMERQIFPEHRARTLFNAVFRKDGWLRRDRRTVLWFGTPGRMDSKTGLYALRLMKDALAAVNAEIPLQLLVVSSSRKLFRHHTQDYPVPCVFRPWSLLSMYGHFQSADVTMIPNPQDAFSIVKSANRTIFSLSEGTPVIADPVPALSDFEDCTHQGDWAEGLRAYLGQPGLAKQHIERARKVIANRYSLASICEDWRRALEGEGC